MKQSEIKDIATREIFKAMDAAINGLALHEEMSIEDIAKAYSIIEEARQILIKKYM